MRRSLGLTGTEVYDIEGLRAGARNSHRRLHPDSGETKRFDAKVRIDTPKEWEYFQTAGYCIMCCASLLRERDPR